MTSSPVLVTPVEKDETWWGRYIDALTVSGMGVTSCEVIDVDSSFIADKVTLPIEEHWPTSRQRSGAVMGAVQSGKTASMIAVAAKSLDHGMDVVIFLAGTQTALWKQTMSRIHSQLDIEGTSVTDRVFVPDMRLLEEERSVQLSHLYSLSSNQVSRALTMERPIIICAMKQVAHLEALAQMLQGSVFPEAQRQKRPVRLLVIDDEADDSSIDGEGTDQTLEYKQIPRRIVDLWESRTQPGRTHNEFVFATYLAYTATPQANFLSDPSNVLYPRDFVVALRTPYDHGELDPRGSTYWVPEKLSGWYTGGEIFYNRLANVPLCLTPANLGEIPKCTDSHELDGVIDAVRGFLVASALRLVRNPGKVSPVLASDATFPTRSAAKAILPDVSSMLVHPSASLEKHFEVREAILRWSGNLLEDDQDITLNGSGVAKDIETYQDRWLHWLVEYTSGTSKVEKATGEKIGFFSPGPDSWPLISNYITDQIAPSTRVAVINSDPNSDDRPSFQVSNRHPDGQWRAPEDLSTIFVSGSVMSRGLTLEGLLMTSFGRTSGSPLADTQMQMQRWFGYRGSYIDLCRVVMSSNQLELFEKYHEADELLRNRTILQMSDASSHVHQLPVLQGPDYLATGKIKPLISRSLDPGARPFARFLNDPERDVLNQQIVASMFNEPDSVLEVPSNHKRSGRARGLLSRNPLSLLQTAVLLDGLQFHSPIENTDSRSLHRWDEIERLVGIDQHDTNFPLYRGLEEDGQRDCGQVSPYDVAAYLRFWNACLDRNPVGVISNTSRPRKWALYPREERIAAAPKIHIGIRFGSGSVVDSGPLSLLPFEFKSMARDVTDPGLLAGTWGTRGADTNIADEAFDLHLSGHEFLDLDADGRRAPGQPGLLLFYPIERSPGQVSLAFGLAIPAGGPDLHLASKVGS